MKLRGKEIVILGKVVFCPSDRIIGGPAKKVAIDPLLCDLLYFLCCRSQEIISRDALAKEVWHLAYVEDNAINRAVSQLRTALKQVGISETIIQTHYRKGYRLTLPPTFSVDSESKPSLPTKKLFTPILATLLGLAITGGATTAYYFTAAVSKSSSQSEQLTWRRGKISYPNLSLNSEWLSYVSRDNLGHNLVIESLSRDAEMDLNVDGLAVDDAMPLQWLSNNQLLIAEPGKQCRWSVLDINNTHKRLVSLPFGGCIGAGVGNVQVGLARNEVFYISDTEPNAISKISSVHLTDNSVSRYDIGVPKNGFTSGLKLSPDGNALLYLYEWDATVPKWARKKEIRLLDVKSAQVTRLAEVDPSVMSVHWHVDGNTAVYFDPEHRQVFFLTKDGKVNQLLPAPNINDVVGMKDGSLITIETDMDERIYQVELGIHSQLRPVSRSHAAIHSPVALNNSAGLIYLSARTGKTTLWKQIEGRLAERVNIDADFTSIEEMAISSDDRLLAVLSASELRVFDLINGALAYHRKIEPTGRYVNLSWHPTELTILMNKKSQSGWHVLQWQLASNQLNKIVEDAYDAKYISNSEIVYASIQQGQLVKKKLGQIADQQNLFTYPVHWKGDWALSSRGLLMLNVPQQRVEVYSIEDGKMLMEYSLDEVDVELKFDALSAASDRLYLQSSVEAATRLMTTSL